MQSLEPVGEKSIKMEFIIPARCLIGFRSELLTDTRGEGIMHHLFSHYGSYKGDIPGRRRGVLIAYESGDATPYGLVSMEDRGTLFVKPGQKVYAGMIVGEHARENDLEINVCKKKHLTNIRASAADDAIKPVPPRIFALEQAMEFIAEDELVEVTPAAIRMRKKILDRNIRERASKKR